MARMIFVSLPVADLKRSIAFYQAVGAVKNEQFCDDTTACMAFSDTIYVMLTTPDKFNQFTPKKIADARTICQVLLCLSADSRDEVDDLINRAVGAGGTPDPSPVDDFSFMYGRSFDDPDGHGWGVNYMDMEAAEAQFAAENA